MSKQAFTRNIWELRSGIEACLAIGARMPTLVLLYSAIDVIAWLSNDDPAAGVGKRFMAWVDQYLLKAKPLECTSADIYGARCGLVHKLGADSDMSDRGKARLISYAWGNRSAGKLQALTVRAGLDHRYVCVKIEDLVEAWQLGVDLLVQEMDSDSNREDRILARAAKFFDEESTDTLDRIIERAQVD
ncbi:MAG: hypothetical protein U0840_23910 [Gemmataceae bacterium]